MDAHQEQSFRAALGPGALKLLAVGRLEWLDTLPRMPSSVARVRHVSMVVPATHAAQVVPDTACPAHL
jgi:hypothetical protein